MPREKSTNLVLITIRLTAEAVKHARTVAKRLAIPYQHVIRGWVTDAANEAKAQDKRGQDKR